jgi:hypothetical protein
LKRFSDEKQSPHFGETGTQKKGRAITGCAPFLWDNIRPHQKNKTASDRTDKDQHFAGNICTTLITEIKG